MQLEEKKEKRKIAIHCSTYIITIWGEKEKRTRGRMSDREGKKRKTLYIHHIHYFILRLKLCIHTVLFFWGRNQFKFQFRNVHNIGRRVRKQRHKNNQSTGDQLVPDVEKSPLERVCSGVVRSVWEAVLGEFWFLILLID